MRNRAFRRALSASGVAIALFAAAWIATVPWARVKADGVAPPSVPCVAMVLGVAAFVAACIGLGHWIRWLNVRRRQDMASCGSRTSPWIVALGLFVGTVAVCAKVYLFGLWKEHAEAVSPDGRRIVESRNLYRAGGLYGWSHFHLRVSPSARFRCTTPSLRWRETPESITDWKLEHRYANYNDFDNGGRYPVGVRWLSNTEFVVEGGEGNGARFELEK